MTIPNWAEVALVLSLFIAAVAGEQALYDNHTQQEEVSE